MPPYASQPDDIISEEAFLFTPATPYSPRITCILVPVQKRVQISGTVVMTYIIFPHLHVHKLITHVRKKPHDVGKRCISLKITQVKSKDLQLTFSTLKIVSPLFVILK